MSDHRVTPAGPAGDAAAAALEASELDRRRIARELHDHLGQTLAAANIALDMARLGGDGNELIDEAQLAVQESARTTREFTFALRAPLLAEQGVAAALRAFAQGLNERTIDPPTFLVEVPDTRWPRAIEIALYRIGQELVRNAVQHAGAHEVTVTLVDTADGLVFSFDDDGRGFDPQSLAGDPEASRRFGLRIVDAIARARHGHCTITSTPGAGARVTVTMPASTDA